MRNLFSVLATPLLQVFIGFCFACFVRAGTKMSLCFCVPCNNYALLCSVCFVCCCCCIFKVSFFVVVFCLYLFSFTISQPKRKRSCVIYDSIKDTLYCSKNLIGREIRSIFDYVQYQILLK